MTTGVNIANIGTLKTKYEDLIVKSLATGAKAFNIPTVKNWEGDFVEWAVHVKRNPNMGFVEDGGEFSTPGKQTYIRARCGRRFYQTKLQISRGAMAAAATTEGSFIAAVDSEVQGVTRDAIDFFNRVFFRDGTGVVATLKGTPASLTANIQVDDTSLLWEDGVYEVKDTSNANADLGDIRVLGKELAIDTQGFAQFSLDTTYLAGAMSASAVGGAVGVGDKLVWKNGFNRTLSGLDILIDDSATTFQNVNVATYPNYSSYVNSAGGNLRTVTPLVLRQLLAAVKTRLGNTQMLKPFTVISNAFIAKEFEEMYEGALRIENGATTVGLNITTFQSALGRIKLEVDTDCLRNTIFLIDPSQLVHYVQKKLSFDKDGSTIFRNSHGALHATAIMTQISQMMIKDRRTSAKITDIADNAVVAS